MRPNANNFHREINCDFFRVQIGNNGNDNLVNAVDHLLGSNATILERNLRVDDGYLRLHGWNLMGDTAQGALLRLRTINNASIARISQDDLRDLQLGRDEALAEYACFCYFAEFQTLVMHRNRVAGTHNRLAQYVEAKSGFSPIHMMPILTEDALRRLNHMREITIAEIKIAMPDNLAIFDTPDMAVGEMINIARLTGAATITTRISMDHSRTPLNIAVKDWFSSFVSAFRGNTEVARIRGRGPEGNDELVTIDLLEDRMQERVDLRSTNSRPAMSDFHDALRTAYDRRRADIARQFDTDST